MSDDNDPGTEAEYLEMWSDEGWHESDGPRIALERPAGSHYRGGDKAQIGRWRCLVSGCNPRLNEASAQAHRDTTGHRVAKWPVRSKAGKAKARERNRDGYYDKYNVGYKSAELRLR